MIFFAKPINLPDKNIWFPIPNKHKMNIKVSDNVLAMI